MELISEILLRLFVTLCSLVISGICQTVAVMGYKRHVLSVYSVARWVFLIIAMWQVVTVTKLIIQNI